MWKVLSQATHVQYESSITSCKKVMAKVKVFQKKVKLQGQVQYESPISSGEKVMAKVKVFVHSHMPTQMLGLWY